MNTKFAAVMAEYIIRNISPDFAFDEERWITVYPNGKGAKKDGTGDKSGFPVLIDGDNGEIKGGMGGKFKGYKINEINKEFVGPKATRKEKENAQIETKRRIAEEKLKEWGRNIMEKGAAKPEKAPEKPKKPKKLRGEKRKNVMVDFIKWYSNIDISKDANDKYGFMKGGINVTGPDHRIRELKHALYKFFDFHDNGGLGTWITPKDENLLIEHAEKQEERNKTKAKLYD